MNGDNESDGAAPPELSPKAMARLRARGRVFSIMLASLMAMLLVTIALIAWQLAHLH